MKLYEIYKSNRSTGNKTKLADQRGKTAADALERFLSEKRGSKKGKYLVLPFKVRAQYTIVK